MQLRDYLYLDSKRLEDYMSILDPGDLRELREVIREDNAGLEIPMPKLGKSSDIGSGKREETTERALSVSAKHSFNRLYEKLLETLIDVDTNVNADSIKRGMAVEATREFEPSPVAQMIDSLLDLIRMMQSFNVPELKDEETKHAMAFMSNLFRGDTNREKDVPVVSNLSDATYSIAFLAERQYLLRRPEELSGELTLVGKVRRVIPRDQDLDLLAFSNVLPRSMTRSTGASAEIREAIVQLFANWPEELGHALERDSLIMKGPIIIIDPLAVFM